VTGDLDHNGAVTGVIGAVVGGHKAVQFTVARRCNI
jgi:hypothetical protein